MHIVTLTHTLTWLKKKQVRVTAEFWYDVGSFRARFGSVMADSGAAPLTGLMRLLQIGGSRWQARTQHVVRHTRGLK